MLRQALDAARLDNDDRLAAVRGLDQQARRLERVATGPPFTDVVAGERAHSPGYGGRTVHDRSS